MTRNMIDDAVIVRMLTLYSTIGNVTSLYFIRITHVMNKNLIKKWNIETGVVIEFLIEIMLFDAIKL